MQTFVDNDSIQRNLARIVEKKDRTGWNNEKTCCIRVQIQFLSEPRILIAVHLDPIELIDVLRIESL